MGGSDATIKSMGPSSATLSTSPGGLSANMKVRSTSAIPATRRSGVRSASLASSSHRRRYNDVTGAGTKARRQMMTIKSRSQTPTLAAALQYDKEDPVTARALK